MTALLAIARDDEERVVDTEREAHAGEHVHDEHRELELLGDESGQAERHDDREHRHQERHQPGDDPAEDEQQDDQRGGQSNWNSPDFRSSCESWLKSCSRVVSPVTSTSKLRVRVGLPHGGDDAPGVVGVRDGDQPESCPPVAGHERRSALHTVEPA